MRNVHRCKWFRRIKMGEAEREGGGGGELSEECEGVFGTM